MKKVGLGRIEVSARLDGIAFCALSSEHPGNGILKGFGKVWIFMILSKGVQIHKFVKMHDEHCRIFVSRALEPCKTIYQKFPKTPAWFRPTNTPDLRHLFVRIPVGRGFSHVSQGSRTNGSGPCERAQQISPCSLKETTVQPNVTFWACSESHGLDDLESLVGGRKPPKESVV